MQAYLSANLILRRFPEPAPPDDTLRHNPSFEDWYRIPEFTAHALAKALATLPLLIR